MKQKLSITAKFFILANLLFFFSCSTVPKGAERPSFSIGGFSTSVGKKEEERELPSRWWTEFGDGALNSLVEQALSGNFSLKSAGARLDQARASASASSAELWPEITGSAGTSRRISETGSTRTETNNYSLGLSAAYEVDLWGRVGAVKDAAVLDALATKEDLDAAAVSLSAQVARTLYRLMEQKLQLELIDEQIKTNQDYLGLIELRFRSGKATAADVLQQRQLVEANRGERLTVEADLKVLENQLAVLLGEAPGRFQTSQFSEHNDLPELPPLPAVGPVGDWLRRRPDLRAAELRIRAADHRVAAAVAARYPRLDLSLRGETNADLVRDLFDTWLANLAANLTGPLLDFGLRRAEAERAMAASAQALHDFGQGLLNAMAEVENALVREARQTEYVASLNEQLRLSASAVDQIKDKYSKGVGDFTRYLSALLAHQRLQRTQLQSRRHLIEYRIDLYRAVAGRIFESKENVAQGAKIEPQNIEQGMSNDEV